jgi:hypothetical protein
MTGDVPILPGAGGDGRGFQHDGEPLQEAEPGGAEAQVQEGGARQPRARGQVPQVPGRGTVCRPSGLCH